MNLEEKLKKQQYKEIWQQYCGFLDLSMDGYMKIQRRLMEEQIRLWSNCGLGQSILKGKYPKNLDEFRKMVPLTTYEDYADVLLTKQPDINNCYILLSNISQALENTKFIAVITECQPVCHNRYIYLPLSESLFGSYSIPPYFLTAAGARWQS